MSDLLNKKCIPCHGGNIIPFSYKEAQEYLNKIQGWNLSQDAKKISKEFKFKDFVEAVSFINKVAEISESEGHHPDIHIYYSKVFIEIWTHAINGLSENDFILAAKIDKIFFTNSYDKAIS